MLACTIAASSALLLSPLRPAAPLRAAPRMGEGDELGGAISSTFGEIFGSFFKPNAEREAEIDRAYAEQLEVAEQRRRGGIDGVASRMRATEERRAKESAAFTEKFAWQQGADPLSAFLKRRDEGKVKKIGYEDEPKGGIPMPMASFGVGGEFGTGGKYDNGERFDLRLPFVDQGWVDESDSLNSGGASWFSKLGSGGAKKPAAKKSTPAKKGAKVEKWVQGRSGPMINPAWKAQNRK